MKAREVRERLKGLVSAEVSAVIEAVAEQQSVHSEQMLVLANANEQLMSMINSTLTVAGNMKDMIESVQGDSTDDGPTV
jgi:hypothetical protein|tara:strand:+ start:724 stop:960 length:237 start_codon:yes stop_codon:yes gene_type:complete